VLKSDGCWLWTGATGANGYGHLTIDGTRVYVHRFSFALHVRQPLDGEFVCHTCDVRNCVRPDHLFAGSVGDNNRDMWDKGRGVINPVWLISQRLTDEQRDEMVRRYAAGETGSSIAKDFAVTRQYVGQIARRRGVRRG
jgi:uncharacterized protein (DUF433 family)